MKPFMDLEAYRKSVYKLFGRFPVLLMVISVVGAYIIGIGLGMAGSTAMDDPVGFEGMSNAFFRGVLFTVILYYVGRLSADSGVKRAHGLTDREPMGHFIPCMSHKHMMDLSMGNIVVLPDRLYFEPSRPFGGDLEFDFSNFEGFKFTLSDPRASMGLFLITGEKYMLTVEDKDGKCVGKFIMPEPEAYLPELQKLL